MATVRSTETCSASQTAHSAFTDGFDQPIIGIDHEAFGKATAKDTEPSHLMPHRNDRSSRHPADSA